MKSRKIVRAKSKADKIINFKVIHKDLEDDGCVGQCWPFTRRHIIEIDPRQYPSEYMDTLIHEALHEIYPKNSEKNILRAASSLANLLWRMGYRRVRKRH